MSVDCCLFLKLTKKYFTFKSKIVNLHSKNVGAY